MNVETRLCEFVLPPDTNHLGTLYGGTMLAWMDKAAGVAGLRRAGRAVVTAAVDKLVFRVPVRAGELVELIARVESVGRTSMVVAVDVFREDPESSVRELCTTGHFTMVAVDDEGRPVPVRAAPAGLSPG
ncbi:MAG: acyl-CoA thioesterase [Thermoleophilia bacterium]